MIVGRVVGTVVATQKDRSLEGRKMLTVQTINIQSWEDSGEIFVALDVVGAGQDEIVMVVSGSSARFAEGFENKALTDRTIIAIIDSVNVTGKSVYMKD